MYICMYAYIYIYVCIYICMYIYIETYDGWHSSIGVSVNADIDQTKITNLTDNILDFQGLMLIW
jgi:hypothetical protein